MNSTTSRFVLASLLSLTVAAIAIVVVGSRRNSSSVRRSQEFQQAFGGLGFGPAIDLSRCTLAFDPRLGSVCESQFEPLPGGQFACPHHAGSVFEYSSLTELIESTDEAAPDATVP